MAMQADVIIVGAGPAGCAAAYDLNAAGLDVLLLDKSAFPRRKPCAGAVTIKTLKALRYDITPVIRRVCDDFQVGLRTEKSMLFHSRYPIAVGTVRSELDDFCLNQCLGRGVSFRRIGALTRIYKDADQWAVATASEKFCARFLIGADGANSQVRKLAGIASETRFGVALETNVPADDALNFQMTMDYGVVPRGYAWVFPKDDHLNVGLYTLDSKIRDSRTVLAEYCQARTGYTASAEVHGSQIPYNGVRFRHVPGNPMLVGDAAGLIDPLLGEGIYNAIRSGQIAAESVLDMVRGRGDTYGRKIREITSDLWWYDQHLKMFYRNLDLGYRSLIAAPVRCLLMKGMALGWTYKQMQFRFPLVAFVKPNNYLLSGLAVSERSEQKRRACAPSDPYLVKRRANRSS